MTTVENKYVSQENAKRLKMTNPPPLDEEAKVFLFNYF